MPECSLFAFARAATFSLLSAVAMLLAIAAFAVFVHFVLGVF